MSRLKPVHLILTLIGMVVIYVFLRAFQAQEDYARHRPHVIKPR